MMGSGSTVSVIKSSGILPKSNICLSLETLSNNVSLSSNGIVILIDFFCMYFFASSNGGSGAREVNTQSSGSVSKLYFSLILL